MVTPRRIATAVADLFGAREERARIARAGVEDEGHGYDLLGLHPEFLAAALSATRWLYTTWFRVRSRGVERVPPSGPAIVAANHGGTLPVDAVLLAHDLVRRAEPPRIPRVVTDLFVPAFPVAGALFSRIGVVTGAREVVERLLERGELLAIFPEGTPGIGKPYRERYRLKPFRVGFAELAIRYRAPVVPVAIVGVEGAWPLVARIDTLHPFGAPFVPVPATPFPLPMPVELRYGAPMALHDRWRPEQADDPEVLAEAAGLVRAEVQSMLDEALHARRRP